MKLFLVLPVSIRPATLSAIYPGGLRYTASQKAYASLLKFGLTLLDTHVAVQNIVPVHMIIW